MECLFSYGGSRKHRYEPYKTFFLRKLGYRCQKCAHKVTPWEYDNWIEMHKKKEELIRRYYAVKGLK